MDEDELIEEQELEDREIGEETKNMYNDVYKEMLVEIGLDSPTPSQEGKEGQIVTVIGDKANMG